MRKPALAVAAALVGMTAAMLPAQAQTSDSQAEMNPSKALAILKEGSERFAAGKRTPRDYATELRATTAPQHPFAAVVSCVDSRAPVEILFDRGIGDVFILRGAGDVIDEDVLGSLEYAVKPGEIGD